MRCFVEVGPYSTEFESFCFALEYARTLRFPWVIKNNNNREICFGGSRVRCSFDIFVNGDLKTHFIGMNSTLENIEIVEFSHQAKDFQDSFVAYEALNNYLRSMNLFVYNVCVKSP